MFERHEPVTMSAYDLLPDEDRKAIAWVREHGGLDSVEDAIKTNEWALSLAVIAHDALFGEDSERDTTPTEFKREIDKRLMPAGMEWPMFEDNEPVRFGDEHENGKGNASPLNRVCFYIDGTTILGRGQTKVRLAPGERVKRPALKVVDADGVDCRIGDAVWWVRNRTGNFRIVRIEPDGKCAIHNDDVNEPCGMTVPSTELTRKRPVLDADGAEIHAGDVLYSVETGGSVTVDSIEPGNPWFATTDGALQHCAKFAHRAPVLAADGKPLKEGETVWHVGNGVEFTVIGLPRSVEYQAVKLRLDDGAVTGLDPDQLTHEQPDTWERLEHDAEKTVCEYFGANYDCANCPLESARCAEEVKKDIIRRAKKLAERGA